MEEKNKANNLQHAAINISTVLKEITVPLYVTFKPFCVHSVHKIGAVNIRTVGDFDDFSAAMLDFGQRFPYAPNRLNMSLVSLPLTMGQSVRFRI